MEAVQAPACPDQQCQFQGSNLDISSLAPTPINIKALSKYLKLYPNKEVANELLTGFSSGFRLGYTGPRVPTSCKNLISVQENPEIAFTKIMKEVEMGRIAGPFSSPPLQNLRLSPIGLVPKKDSSWRLIQHLSYPQGVSVNDFIDKQLCSVSYTPFDKVIESIVLLGRNCECGKIDIKSAFRLLPVHPEDFVLLGFALDEKYFVDKVLPMGCSISCAVWEKFATFLEWLVSYVQNDSILHHYLDDYIFLGAHQSGQCQKTMNTFMRLCEEINLPLASDKTVGPTPILVFLGLELDTILQNVRIPFEKVQSLRSALLALLTRKKCTLKEMQSLVGLLNFCSRAIPTARAFNRRFYDAMAGLSKPSHHLRITSAIKLDLSLWLMFIEKFNGYCSFPEYDWSGPDILQLYTDSAGSAVLGCAAVFGTHWVFFPWPASWQNTDLLRDMTTLELLPVVLAFQIWGRQFRAKKIMLFIDNLSLVYALNKKSARSKRVMHLLRPLVLQSMLLNIQFKAQHLSTKLNDQADSLSRCQWQRFRLLAPSADRCAAPIPEGFLHLVSELRLISC